MALPRLFGMKAYPAPLVKPFWPFLFGALVTSYLINNIQNTMLQSDEFKNDPRNPNAVKH